SPRSRSRWASTAPRTSPIASAKSLACGRRTCASVAQPSVPAPWQRRDARSTSLREQPPRLLGRGNGLDADRHRRDPMRDIVAFGAFEHALERAVENAVEAVEYFGFLPEQSLQV